MSFLPVDVCSSRPMPWQNSKAPAKPLFWMAPFLLVPALGLSVRGVAGLFEERARMHEIKHQMMGFGSRFGREGRMDREKLRRIGWLAAEEPGPR